MKHRLWVVSHLVWLEMPKKRQGSPLAWLVWTWIQQSKSGVHQNDQNKITTLEFEPNRAETTELSWDHRTNPAAARLQWEHNRPNKPNKQPCCLPNSQKRCQNIACQHGQYCFVPLYPQNEPGGRCNKRPMTLWTSSLRSKMLVNCLIQTTLSC